MWKKIIKGDTSKGQAPSNAGTRNTSEVAQASSSTGLKRNSNDDRSSELARRMQEHEDKISGYNRAQDSQSSSQNRDNKGAAYPEAIQDDLDAVREFISDVMATTCYKCDTQLIHEFTAAKWFKKWETAQKHNDNPSICAAICPQSRCNALTCLGCGNKPFIGQNTKHVEGYKVDWCCETGQLFAIWLLLCRYDEVELAVQARSTDASSKTSSTMGRPHQGSSNGTGYGGAGSQYPPPGYLYNMGRVGPQLEFKKTDSQTDNVTQIIFSLINALLPLYENEEPPIGLHEMIELSFFQDRAAQLLRNDSIADVAKRGKLYRSVITFVEKVGTHPHTRFLIMDGRYSRKKSPGLGPLSLPDPSIIANGETASGRNKDKGKTKNKRKAATALDLEVEEGEMSGSLLDNMQNLSIICEALIKTAKATRTGFDDRSGRDMLSLARYIADVYERIDRIREKQERKNRKTKSNGDSESTKQSSPWEQYNVEHRVEYSTSVMANVLSSYRVRAEQMRESPTGRIRRIFTELVDMITSLTPGIFVRAQIERPDVIKALIVGPQDTPYEGGLFEWVFSNFSQIFLAASADRSRFDIFCPKDYPAVSPNCWFRTTNGGRVRFNPNLHADGKGMYCWLTSILSSSC